MSFEYDFFRNEERCGVKIAESYGEFRKQHPLKEDASISERMKYIGEFCASAGLKHPDVFLEIEDAREQERMAQLRKSAMVAIMVRGGSVPVRDSLRKRIEQILRK